MAVTAWKHAAQELAHSRSPEMSLFFEAHSCGPLGSSLKGSPGMGRDKGVKVQAPSLGSLRGSLCPPVASTRIGACVVCDGGRGL